MFGKLCKLPVKGVDCSLVSAYNMFLYVVTSYPVRDISLQSLSLYKFDLRSKVWTSPISFDFDCFGTNHFKVLNIHLIKYKIYLFVKVNTINKCKIVMVEWTADKTYPKTEIFICCEEEEVQFSVLKNCKVAIFCGVPQVYHKNEKYGYSSLFTYDIDY